MCDDCSKTMTDSRGLRQEVAVNQIRWVKVIVEKMVGGGGRSDIRRSQRRCGPKPMVPVLQPPKQLFVRITLTRAIQLHQHRHSSPQYPLSLTFSLPSRAHSLINRSRGQRHWSSSDSKGRLKAPSFSLPHLPLCIAHYNGSTHADASCCPRHGPAWSGRPGTRHTHHRQQ